LVSGVTRVLLMAVHSIWGNRGLLGSMGPYLSPPEARLSGVNDPPPLLLDGGLLW
jgi:hypothetical protein